MKLKDLFEIAQDYGMAKARSIHDLIKAKPDDWPKGTPGGMWAGDLHCQYKELTSLDGSPKFVDGDFFCHDNFLVSLEGGPQRVHGDYHCDHNFLTSLTGVPDFTGGDFYCGKNKLKSLDGVAFSFKGIFSCEDNQIESLHNIHKQIKHMYGTLFFTKNPIKSHVLGVLLIDGCTQIFLDNKEVEKIMNKYLPNERGREAIYDCQEDLINAGLDEYAQL